MNDSGRMFANNMTSDYSSEGNEPQVFIVDNGMRVDRSGEVFFPDLHISISDGYHCSTIY